jgi:hypothetical protein
MDMMSWLTLGDDDDESALCISQYSHNGVIKEIFSTRTNKFFGTVLLNQRAVNLLSLLDDKLKPIFCIRLLSIHYVLSLASPQQNGM